MKLKSFEAVKHLIETLNKIDSAIDATRDYDLTDTTDERDVGYWGTFSKHSDGSGDQINLNGCFVEFQVIESIEKVLLAKRQDILDALTNQGVEV